MNPARKFRTVTFLRAAMPVTVLLGLNACVAQAQSDATAPPPAAVAPTAIDLPGYKLAWSDEFNEVSWTDKSPKESAKWISFPSVPGKLIGFQIHDNDSMAIQDGILVNTLRFVGAADVGGNRCAGPVGMKSDSGAELITVEKLGEIRKKDDRLMWGGSGWVGMKFTTPAAGLTVGELGRYNIAGSTGTYDVRLFDAATGDDVAKAMVHLNGQPAGWVYGKIEGGNKMLPGNHTYYLVTPTVHYAGGYKNDPWYDGRTTVTASGGITISQSVWGNWHAGSLFSIDKTGAGFMQQYGYWEARVKLPAGGVGIWPSWCLYTHNKSGLGEEVDIFEYYGGAFDKDKDGGFGMRNHNWGDGPKEADVDAWPAVSKPWLNWHVYGFLSTPTQCVFYVDGKKIAEYATPTSYQNSPMYMTLEYNTGGFWPMHGLIANSHMDVDWLRVWAAPEK